jgi:hypothetical protein
LLHAVTLDERIEAERKAYQKLQDNHPKDLYERIVTNKLPPGESPSKRVSYPHHSAYR